MSAPGAGDLLLRADQLTLCRGRTEVVHTIDLDVAAGEVVAVLGPNGSGKSTLLAGLAGLLAPIAGAVERNGRVALAQQSGVLAARSARANVELALAWWGVPVRERRDRAMTALEHLGAQHLARRRAGSLSGGERRRVHLARALAVGADVLLLDEPFTALDAGTRDALLDDAVRLLRAEARAVIVVVHDRVEAVALADRLVVLLDGRLVADGTPEQLLENPPSPAVARFMGFTGELTDGPDVLLTRPVHARLDPAGTVSGTVTRRTRLEDGVRLDVRCPTGHLQVVTSTPAPDVGATITLTVTGGARFPASSA